MKHLWLVFVLFFGLTTSVWADAVNLPASNTNGAVSDSEGGVFGVAQFHDGWDEAVMFLHVSGQEVEYQFLTVGSDWGAPVIASSDDEIVVVYSSLYNEGYTYSTRSTTQGQTWEDRVEIGWCTNHQDFPALTHSDEVYCLSWVTIDGEELHVSSSSDGGQSWDIPVVVYDSYTFDLSNPSISGHNGEFTTTWIRGIFNTGLMLARSDESWATEEIDSGGPFYSPSVLRFEEEYLVYSAEYELRFRHNGEVTALEIPGKQCYDCRLLPVDDYLAIAFRTECGIYAYIATQEELNWRGPFLLVTDPTPTYQENLPFQTCYTGNSIFIAWEDDAANIPRYRWLP